MKRLVATFVALGLASPLVAQERSARPVAKAGIAIGDLVWTEGAVDRAEPPDKTAWRRVLAGDKLRTGDTLRTGKEAVARVEFPWMKLTLAPGSMVTIPATAVLSTVLDQGRAEYSGPGRDIVKIQVGEGEVRGGGRVVLRRSAGRTTASVLEGSFRVRAMGRTVSVRAGEGTVVPDGRPPATAAPLPPAPSGLAPGDDVGYVRTGAPVELSWSGGGTSSHVEILALDKDEVLLVRDAAAPPLRLELPWLGTYRWRVSARDGRGVESPPSAHGLVCSVER